MTSSKNNAGTTGADQGTIVALFRNQTDAERAIQDLQAAGVDQSRIGVAIRDHGRQRDLGEVTTTDGYATGGILGGVAGMLAGPGALAVPGVGPLIVAGVLAPALARISAAGGGLVTTLVAMGSTERNANYFEKGLREGSVLVTASAGSLGSEVGEIVRAAGGDLGTPVREVAGDLDLFGSLDEQEDPSDAADVAREPWRGSERRYRDDLGYAGPERRFSRS